MKITSLFLQFLSGFIISFASIIIGLFFLNMILSVTYLQEDKYEFKKDFLGINFLTYKKDSLQTPQNILEMEGNAKLIISIIGGFLNIIFYIFIKKFKKMKLSTNSKITNAVGPVVIIAIAGFVLTAFAILLCSINRGNWSFGFRNNMPYAECIVWR